MPLRPWHLGHIVQNLMEAEGIDSGARLAELAGVAPNTVSAMLNGKGVDGKSVEKVAAVFRLKDYELKKLVDEANQSRAIQNHAIHLVDPATVPRPKGLSDDAIYMGQRFDRLTRHRQSALMSVLLALQNEQSDSENGNDT